MKQLALLLVLAATLLNGCAYGLYDDQRLMGTITDDRTLSAKIKAALLKESVSGGWSIATYSFYGNVFLVGEVPETMQSKAVAVANRYRPRSVTTHWFTPAASGTNNLLLTANLRKELISTKGLSSTRIDMEVNSGRVVLLGVVESEHEKQLALRTARGVPGVTGVTSYLMLPQKAGQLDAGQPEHARGEIPADGTSGSFPGGSGAGLPDNGSGGSSGGVESRDLP